MSPERIGTQNGDDVIKALCKLGGFVLFSSRGKQRGKGSHTLIKMPGVVRPVCIHDDELQRKELRTICREAELDWEVFCYILSGEK